jgi:lipoate-protein ligase A
MELGPECAPLDRGPDPPPAVGGKEWRYFEGALPGIAANLALDEALLIEADERGAGPALRIWEPEQPAVILGASGRWREDIKIAACQADGVAIARRSSGGGTVVIGPGSLNVAVVLPASAAPGLTAVDTAQAYVLDRIARAIRASGPTVERLGSGDLTLDRRKFSGSAQRRLRDHFLVHASLLFAFPLDLVERYTHLPRRQPAYRENRSHLDFLVNLPLPRARLVAAIQEAWLPAQHPSARAAVPEELVAELVRAKFADRAWIERL